MQYIYIYIYIRRPLALVEGEAKRDAETTWRFRGGVWLFRIHCQEAAALGLSGLGCVTFFVYVLGLFSSPLGAPKVPLRHPANDRFSLRLRPDLGGVWLFRIHCQEAAALGLSGLGCVTFFVYVLGLFSSPLGAPKVPLRHPANDRFSLRLRPDLGGVWLFRIHCQEAAALGLSGLGCVTFFVYVLGLFSSPLGAPKVPLRHPANDRFSLRLRPDLGGVWLFRIHCQEAAALGLSGLGCVTFFVYVLGLFSSPLGAPKVPLRHPANDRFSLRLRPDLGGVWLFRIHCQEAAALGLSGLGCVTFFVYVLGLFSSPFGAPKVPLRHPTKGPFFASPETGFRWCLAVSDPLPRGCRLGLFSFPLGAPKVPLRHPANDRFSLRLRPDLGGVWLFRIHCQEAAALGLSGLGCVTFFVYVLGLFSSPLGAPKVPLRHPANDRFSLRLRPDLGGVWLFRIHCQEAAALGLSGLGCVTFFVYVLGLFSSPLGAPKVPLRHPANDRFSLRLRPDLGGVWLFRIHCQEAAALGLSGLGCVTFFVYVLGLFSSPLGAPKVPLRHPANDRFSLRLRPDLGGVWLFRIHCQEAAALGLSGLGCVTFFVYVLVLFSSPLGAPKVPLRHPANDRFSLRLRPDLGGVWLFRIHCQEAAAFGLSGLGCVTFFVYVLGLFSSPLGAPKVPLRHPANDRFSLRLRPDLGGVWLFRIHCQEAAALRLSGLGCVTFFVYVLGAFFFSFRGSKGATSPPCEWPFFASSETGFRWCLAVSDPLPRGCRFGFVRARLCHAFCLRTGAFFFSFRGSNGATSPPCEWPFFASPETGFRWCLAVSDPLPRGGRFGFVRARLRHVFCLRTGAFFFSFRGSKGATSPPCEWPFFASPETGFRWCLAVSDPLPRGCRFAFVRARLRHAFCLRTGAFFFSFRGSKGATSPPCEWPFFASPETGFRWCLAVSDPLPRGCRFGFVRARLCHVFCLRTGAFFFSFRGSKGATSPPCEWPFFASPETGFRWCLAVSDPLPRGCRFGFVRARLCHVFCLRTGAFFFSFRGSKGATSQPCEWPFFASPETGFRWCFAVLSRMALLKGRRHGR